MKKICSILCLCIAIALSSCGGVDSKIKDYEKAMQENNFEKASEILSGLDAKQLTEDQKKKISEIHEEYYEKAVDAYIKEIEKKIKKGDIKGAYAMLNGVKPNALTDKQYTKILELKENFTQNSNLGGGGLLEEQEELTNLYDDALGVVPIEYITDEDIEEIENTIYDEFDEEFDF